MPVPADQADAMPAKPLACPNRTIDRGNLQMRARELVTSRLAPAARMMTLSAAVVGVAAAAAHAESLKFGNEGIYPPFSIVDSNGVLGGVEPDLAREVCKRMNAECEIIVMDFKALIPSLLQGKFDGITTQLAPTPERAEKGLFTIPIVYNPTTFVAPAGSNFVYTKEGLTGKDVKLGIQRGSAGIPYAQKLLGDAVTYVYYDNPDQVRLDLLAGRINMTFDSKINWTIELINKPEGKDWKLAGGDHWIGDPSLPESERGFRWMIRKDKGALLERVNATLQDVIKDCTYTKIRKKYLDITTLPQEAACVDKTN
jgi:arginine/ornithine transport system substrate-binding protein